jgi:hypothetical protein
MKIEATFKRRMWKVAIAHFVLTAFFGLSVLLRGWVFSGTQGMFLEVEAWRGFKIDALLFLQPQFWLLSQMGKPIGPFWFFAGVCLISIPIWSFCFGWFYVRFVNWLNHFPILGKRVF